MNQFRPFNLVQNEQGSVFYINSEIKDLPSFRPVNLNDNWLRLFEFVQDGTNAGKWIKQSSNGNFVIELVNDNCYKKDDYTICNVHFLQNLYKYQTGEDLIDLSKLKAITS